MEGMFLIIRGICTQQICGKQGEQWKKAPWSQVCVYHGTAANSAVQRVMLLRRIVLLPNLLEAFLLL
jgi:Ni,Fe-hydrogenase III small subunit